MHNKLKTNLTYNVSSKSSNRYKINVYGVDPGNSEDSKPIHAEFMFFGDIGQQLVGRPAMLLVAATEGQTQHIPPEIKAVIGQRYQLIVQMSEGSLQAENPTFHVRSFAAQPDHSSLLPGKQKKRNLHIIKKHSAYNHTKQHFVTP